MISNELLEEIIDISLKGKYINRTIVIKAFNEIFQTLDIYTQNNFEELIFGKINRKRNIQACCAPDSKNIAVDLLQLYYELNKHKNFSMLMRNLSIITTLFHEVEHLKEPYKISKNNFESKLLKCSEMYDEELQDRVYDYIPCEKIAFANSHKIMLNNIKNYPDFKNKYFDEYRRINNNYILNLKRGYCFFEDVEQYNVPLYCFLKETNQTKFLSELCHLKLASDNNINKISIDKKLKYGLPITKEDIDEINKKKILTKSIK